MFFSNREVNQENIDQVKGQALKSLVDTKLMRDELKKYDFNFKNTDVKKYLEDISYKMNISNQELIKLFEIKKIDFEKYVEEIKINLTWQQFIYQLYSAKVSIDEDQISNEQRIMWKYTWDLHVWSFLIFVDMFELLGSLSTSIS